MAKSLLKMKLEHVVTEFDQDMERKAKKNPKRFHYNQYALGLYLMRLDEVVERIEKGEDTRKVLLNCFNDRLLSALLKSFGLPLQTKDEM
jgi:primosomal protein N''